MSWESAKSYSPVVLRVALALVFLWFSASQFIFPNDFTGYIPSFLVTFFGVSPVLFVIGNASLEFVLGMFLILGVHVRFSSIILAVHLLGIAFSLGYGPIMIRDLGLSVATFAVFLNGRDRLCIQK